MELLEDPGPDPGLDVVPRPGLDDDGLDRRPGQQVGEQQAGRAGSDDGDLSSHARSLRVRRAGPPRPGSADRKAAAVWTRNSIVTFRVGSRCRGKDA